MVMSPKKVLPKPIGTVISDRETPTFEIVRIRLKAGQDIKPGTLVKINVSRTEKTTLFARIRSGYEKNPDESADKQSTLDTFNMPKIPSSEENHPDIYRLIEADLIEEIIGEEIRSPQNLPNSGAEVFIADSNDILRVLGLEKKDDDGLYIGETVGGIKTQVILKREAIQRHLFIGGTTGSGKSYAMGVVAEEIIKHKVPVIFIDTQDEYSKFVNKQGGKVVEPGENFTIRISSLTESEFIDLLPDAMKQSAVQCDVVAKAFGDLQVELFREGIAQFTLDDILKKIPDIAHNLSAKKGDAPRLEDNVIRRISTLKSYKIFGSGYEVADWKELLMVIENLLKKPNQIGILFLKTSFLHLKWN
ncbi:MAG: ATP-binding protein [Okeania sp. SIO3B3]|nr:ATP-binding protein [Okeania sp. SIO3B3]